MKRRLISAVLSLLLFLSLCSCGIASEKGQDIFVYYLREDPKNRSNILEAEVCELEGNRIPLAFAIEKQFEAPSSLSLRSPFPAGTRVLSYSLNRGELFIIVSKEYESLSGMDLTLANYAITQTFCSFDDIISVSIQTENGKSYKGLTPEDVLNSDFDSNPYEKRILLYFPDTSNRFLIPEHHNITVGQDSSLERYVVEELISGPMRSSLHSPVPEGTKLLSVSVDGTACTVDLSSEFLSARPDTAQAERMTVYSIVNSLTELPGVDSVRILADGENVGNYLHIPISEPLYSAVDLIGSAEPDRLERSIILYAASTDCTQLTMLPVSVEEDEYQTLAFAAIDKLLSLEGCASYINPFPRGTKVFSAVSYNGICRVNLSPEFLNFESPSYRDIACRSLAASLLSLGNISDIQLYVDGERYEANAEDLVATIYNSANLFMK